VGSGVGWVAVAAYWNVVPDEGVGLNVDLTYRRASEKALRWDRPAGEDQHHWASGGDILESAVRIRLDQNFVVACYCREQMVHIGEKVETKDLVPTETVMAAGDLMIVAKVKMCRKEVERM